MPEVENIQTQLDLDALSKYGAVSGVFAYATGILTVNIYLHQLGITDFSLAKPKLVLTGVVVLLAFFLLALFPVFVAQWISGHRAAGAHTSPAPKAVVFLLVLPFLGLVAASAYLCRRNPPGLGEIVVWKVWELINTQHQTVLTISVTTVLIAAAIYLPICLAAVSATKAARSFNRLKLATNAPHRVPERVYAPVALALAVISVIAYIYIFSLTFYPAISPAFGGGKPYLEKFVVAEVDRCQWQQLGIPFVEEHSNITAPLPVLHESDALVAVWLVGTGNWKPIVVQLEKSQISATRMVDPLASKVESPASLPGRCKAN